MGEISVDELQNIGSYASRIKWCLYVPALYSLPGENKIMQEYGTNYTVFEMDQLNCIDDFRKHITIDWLDLLQWPIFIGVILQMA